MMMTPAWLIQQLAAHRAVFTALLTDLPDGIITWKPHVHQWNTLEIVCHLRDEEAEDFRTRVRWALSHPAEAPPAIDPVGWVTERAYAQQDFAAVLADWQRERAESVDWLTSLDLPDWSQGYAHPTQGRRSARFYLTNWLAHDYLHIRQITRLKYDYLQVHTDAAIAYAGTWV